MIKGIFRIAAINTLKPLKHPRPSFGILNHKSSFLFSQDHLSTIMNRLQSGVDEALLKEIAELNEENQEKIIRDIVENVGKKKLSPSVFATSAIANIAKKYTQLYVEILSIRIALTEGELVYKMKKGEITNESVMPYLQTFSTLVAQWTASVPKITKPMAAFNSGVRLNRTSNYIFQHYFSKYILSSKKEQAFRNICDWNKNVIKSIKKTIDDIVNSIEQISQNSTQQNQHESAPILRQQKNFLTFVMDTYSYNMACSHTGREEILGLCQNYEQYKKQLLQLRDNIAFIIPYYQKLGFEDIAFFSERFIEMKRLRTLLSFFQHEKFQALTLTAEEEQAVREMAYEELGKVVGEVIDCFKKIQNKEADVQKLKKIAISIMVLRIQQINKRILTPLDFQSELLKCKQQILAQIPQNLRNMIGEKLEMGIKGALKQKKEELEEKGEK